MGKARSNYPNRSFEVS